MTMRTKFEFVVTLLIIDCITSSLAQSVFSAIFGQNRKSLFSIKTNLQVRSRIQCGVLCERASCRGFNYDENTKNCGVILMNQTRERDTEVAAGVTYYGLPGNVVKVKMSWTYFWLSSCNVPTICTDDHLVSVFLWIHETFFTIVSRWASKIMFCHFVTECIYDKKGLGYEGRITKTISGHTCQRWDQQSPHTHSQNVADFPDTSLEDAANYCRNPSDDPRVWCYTITAVRFEMCDLPCCAGM